MPDDRAGEEPSGHEAVADLGATGAAMREEWRAEQEAATNDAAEQWRHSRTLLDVARDHMHRGDRVEITVAGHRVVGAVVEVARDRIALFDDTAAGSGTRVDVHVAEAVPLTLRVVDRARAGGRSDAHTASFRARLLELEAAGAPVVIATTIAGADRLTGSLAVGTDFVALTTTNGVETAIALTAVAFVSPVT